MKEKGPFYDNRLATKDHWEALVVAKLLSGHGSSFIPDKVLLADELPTPLKTKQEKDPAFLSGRMACLLACLPGSAQLSCRPVLSAFYV